MHKSDAQINFFDRHGQYAIRFWHHIPRVGDEVLLSPGKRYVPDAYGNAAFIVKRVVFGAEGADANYRQIVNIELKAVSVEIEE